MIQIINERINQTSMKEFDLSSVFRMEERSATLKHIMGFTITDHQNKLLFLTIVIILSAGSPGMSKRCPTISTSRTTSGTTLKSQPSTLTGQQASFRKRQVSWPSFQAQRMSLKIQNHIVQRQSKMSYKNLKLFELLKKMDRFHNDFSKNSHVHILYVIF